jgi:hypothetical protein
LTNQINLNFNSGTIKQDIATIPQKLLEGAEEAILQCAYLVLGLAQVHVRVDTGSLRDSGRIERGGQGMHFRQIRVRFGGYVINPKTGKLVDYAAAVEARYPYLKPAVQESESEVRDIVNRVCLASVADLASVTS